MKTIISIFMLLVLCSFDLYAQNTYVPDDNFEQALIDLGYDTVLDDYVLTANIISVTDLDVGQKNISDLTGIEDFTTLTTLHCFDNLLQTLDVSQNLAITGLYCQYNELTGLDVTQNAALRWLNCRTNQITTLDVSNNTLLQQLSCNSNLISALDLSLNTDLNYLHCGLNQLSGLDVSQNTALTNLFFNNNQLSNIDLSYNLALANLHCQYNQLASIDLSQNVALYKLFIYSNQLNSLDIRNGNNTAIADVDFQAGNNPNLTCIFVDDAVWSAENWSYIDPITTFVETQAECDALHVNEAIISQNISLYPNPASDILTIQSESVITSVVVYDSLGKLVHQYFVDEIDISNLSKGIYYIQVTTESGAFAIIKLLKD